MRFALIHLLLFSLPLVKGAGVDSYSHSALPVVGDEVAVLVLCPGMNGDGKFFLEESPWVDFAKKHRLGLVAINYQSDPELMYGIERRGYYWPDQGAGQALLDAIKKHYGKDLPILIYGFSGGAQFTSRFVQWVPQRVLSWAAYSAQFWDPPAVDIEQPSGIVACGEMDATRWFPSFSYFYQGRSEGNHWAWVSIGDTGHVRHREFESFVRNFFGAVIASEGAVGGAVLVDVGTKELISEDSERYLPGITAWFPSIELFNQWKEIHNP